MTDKSTKSKILRSIVCSIFIGTALLNAQNADKRVPEVRFNTFLYQAKNADFSFPDIKSDFGFVSAFYERICFSFGLLDFVDADTLRKSCAFINRSLKDGKKIQFVVEKYENDADLIFPLVPLPMNGIPSLLHRILMFGKNVFCAVTKVWKTRGECSITL